MKQDPSSELKGLDDPSLLSIEQHIHRAHAIRSRYIGRRIATLGSAVWSSLRPAPAERANLAKAAKPLATRGAAMGKAA